MKPPIKYIVPLDEIEKHQTIGISSGASAPEILVDNFINNLKKQFTVAIEEIEIRIVIKLNKEIKMIDKILIYSSIHCYCSLYMIMNDNHN